MNDLKEKVYDFLKTIPSGKVVTYGQLGQILGNKKYARCIGNILHNNPDPIIQPCFKVVNRQGKLAKNFAGGIETQKQRLEKEGIEVIDYQVDLKKYQWII